MGRVGPPPPSDGYPWLQNVPCGGRNRPFGGCWAADLPAAESRGRRRCAVGQPGRAAPAPHGRGRHRSKRHPGATSGRRTGPFSVSEGRGLWRSQRRPGTRAAGPHVRLGGVKRRRKSPNGVPALPSKGRSKRRRLWKLRSRAAQGEASVQNDLCHTRQMCPTVDVILYVDLFFHYEDIRRQSPYGPVVEHLTESAKIDGSSPGATTAFVVLSETHLIFATQPAPAATFFLAFFCARSSANGSARVRAGERSRLRALSPGTGSRLRKPNWERSQFPASSREIEGPDRGHSAADA